MKLYNEVYKTQQNTKKKSCDTERIAQAGNYRKKKKIKKLMDKIKKRGVRFRWDLPTHLNFTFDTAKHMITTEDQLDKFLSDNVKDSDV